MEPALLIIGSLLFAADLHAQAEPLPTVYPARFSHFAGSGFEVEASATPVKVRVEQPILLTVRVISTGPVTHPPRGKKLDLFAIDTNADFFRELVSEKEEKTGSVWVFVYRCKPKHTRVTTIPPVTLMYLEPTADKLAEPKFTETFPTDEIPIRVSPRLQASTPAEVAKALQPPAHFFEVDTDPRVAATHQAWPWLDPLVLALLLVIPPAGCLACYWTWRRLYPDALAVARRTSNRAVQQALQELKSIDASAERLACVVTEYLRQRVGLAGSEPTPAEVGGHLARIGVSRKVRDQVVGFLHVCDAARYGSQLLAPCDRLGHDAGALIQSLEAEPCVQHSS